MFSLALAAVASSLVLPRACVARSHAVSPHIRSCSAVMAAEIGSTPQTAAEGYSAPLSADEAAAEGMMDDWSTYLVQDRYERLRLIALSISVRRTVDEAELALKLAEEYSADPSILQDIDFAMLQKRLERDVSESDAELRQTQVLSASELDAVVQRQEAAISALKERRAADEELEEGADGMGGGRSGAVADAVPKLRRLISKARELPLTVELPSEVVGEEFDLGLAFNQSKGVARSVKEVWSRLNGGDLSKEEELFSLQRESKALLSLRVEATKLRSGIRLVQRTKEMKSAYLVRFGESGELLDEVSRAESAILKLQKELGLKAALLEMERIYLTLESELSLTSSLVDQLLRAVERYGEMEASLRGMVSLVQADRHEEVDEATISSLLERDIALLLLQLGLTTTEAQAETISLSRRKEAIDANLRRAGEGFAFYTRGVQLMGDDLQLMVNMLTRAVVQGYTLGARETKILRRISKDFLTIIPFIIILIIPLSPLGHVLVFSFIQRFFPDFFPSQFTESRQNIMSMYSSITATNELVESAAGGASAKDKAAGEGEKEEA